MLYRRLVQHPYRYPHRWQHPSVHPWKILGRGGVDRDLLPLRIGLFYMESGTAGRMEARCKILNDRVDSVNRLKKKGGGEQDIQQDWSRYWMRGFDVGGSKSNFTYFAPPIRVMVNFETQSRTVLLGREKKTNHLLSPVLPASRFWSNGS